MKGLVALSAVVILSGATTFAAETWTGQISDNLCGAKHEEAIEGQGKMEDSDCTLACVRGGSKYALVVGEKVYELAQEHPDVIKQAGRKVMLTGELKGNVITVSKVEPAGK